MALVASAALFSSGCSDASSRAEIDLKRFVDNHSSDWQYLNAVEITSEECPSLGCSQAVKSNFVSILKFPTVAAATEYARGCDCHSIDPLVVRFDGEKVTADVRQEIIETLSNINAGSED